MPELRLTQQVAEAFLPQPPAALGVAVSGGGDSMALLHLMHGFCALHGSRLRAVTVDHGLRPEAAAEAAQVARFCAGLGVQHDTLHWQDWDGQGNLQDAARRARLTLIADWARGHGLDTVALGHTADDQAETVLMRLARRAGVDGLAGMLPRRVQEGINWVRPLLAATRADLRSYLEQRGIDWAEDPSNEDPGFERVRARRALAALAPLDIDAQALSEVASHMAAARAALEWQTFLVARRIAEVDAGSVVLDETEWRLQPLEIRRRLLVRAVGWIVGADYPPRRSAVDNMMQAILKGQAATADGVHVRRLRGRIWVFRELEAVREIAAMPNGLWDRRWRVTPRGPALTEAGLTVRALGEAGLAQCPDWRASGRPHAVLLSTPGIWRGDRLVAAPLAQARSDWNAQVDGGDETFFADLLTH